jgi:hypothetical protein
VKAMMVVILQMSLYVGKLGVHGFAPALPFTQDLERHEVLAEDGGYEDAVFFRDDFFGETAFFFDEEGCVAVCES